MPCLFAFLVGLLAGGVTAGASAESHSGRFAIPADYLQEAEVIPPFWVSDVAGVDAFLDGNIRRGEVTAIGRTAGGRRLRAVFYGSGRSGKGTTTFSGALGAKDVRHFYGPDADKKVYWSMAAVHGGEFEGIVAQINFLSVLETGKDLRGRAWPELVEAASRVDRIIVIPITNVDGRARVPLRMYPFGTDKTVTSFFGTGAWADGSTIGWPEVKAFIPLDFSRTAFPGGYPNDAGVNIQHDDFLGEPQPETRALLTLAARERPDLILNLHTGAPPRNYYLRMHRPVVEPSLVPVFDRLYTAVHTHLASEGHQQTKDLALEADPDKVAGFPANLDTALNLHCGALAVLVESPSHASAGFNRQGEPVRHSPEAILDAHLALQLEALRFLAEAGPRSRWAPR